MGIIPFYWSLMQIKIKIKLLNLIKWGTSFSYDNDFVFNCGNFKYDDCDALRFHKNLNLNG